MSDLRTFVNEGKVDEDNARRQAEWERVRKPSEPLEAPAEVFDTRTLYDKLKEQHDIKKKEFEDSHALKNQIRGIDTEEADFLTEVDEYKTKVEKAKKDEEKKELDDYKISPTKCCIETLFLTKTLAFLLYKALEEEKKNKPVSAAYMPKVHITAPKQQVKRQADLLAKVVVKRKNDSDSDDDEESHVTKKKVISKPIIAILPGVGEYNSNSSSSSDYSSDGEHESKPTGGGDHSPSSAGLLHGVD